MPRFRSSGHVTWIVGAVSLLALLATACASDPATDATPGQTSTEVSGSSTPDRDSESSVETDPNDDVVGRSAFDEAQDLFASTVGRDYIVVFEVVSSVTAEAGPIRVEVIDGEAATVDYPDSMTEQILPLIPMLTADDFFDRARAVLAGGGLVEVEFDPSYGYPLVMTLDPIPESIDDEMSIVVRSVDPVEQSSGTDGY